MACWALCTTATTSKSDRSRLRVHAITYPLRLNGQKRSSPVALYPEWKPKAPCSPVVEQLLDVVREDARRNHGVPCLYPDGAHIVPVPQSLWLSLLPLSQTSCDRLRRRSPCASWPTAPSSSTPLNRPPSPSCSFSWRRMVCRSSPQRCRSSSSTDIPRRPLLSGSL